MNGPDSSDDGEFEEDCEAGPGDSSEPGDTDDLSGIARTAAKMPADVAATIPKVPNRLRSPSGRQTAPIPHMKAAATTIDTLAAEESGGSTNSHSMSPIAKSSRTPAPATRSQK